MLICGIDIETTGLTNDAELTEVSWVFMELPLFSTPPVVRQNYCKISAPVSDEILALTKLDKPFLDTWGMKAGDVLWLLEQELGVHRPEFIVAHNGENFDKPFLLHKCTSMGLPSNRLKNTPWLDTGQDLPADKFGSSKLAYMAAECGFINPFPHSAVLDILTMFRVLQACDIDRVIERSREPWVVLQALVKYDDRELAKKRKFRWQDCGSGEIHPKSWVKKVKLSEVDKEKSEAGFEIVVLEKGQK